jgi:hypothetical protein
MSNEENAKQTVEAAKETAGKLFSVMMDLKEKNPKVFFGVAGGVFLLLLVLMMSGGESVDLPKYSAKNLVVGQQYVLKNPNTYEIQSPIHLVAVPGAISAFDDSEDEANGKVDSCRRIAQGAAITVLELQEFAGKKNAFAKIQVEDGACKGSSGWVLSIDVQ